MATPPTSQPPSLPSPLSLSDHATINSLPLETLFHILRYASDGPVRRCDLRERGPTRYSTLSASALVCRGWRRIAQELLWKHVIIRTVKEAEAFVRASRGRRFRTPQLELDVERPSSAKAGSDVVDACVGIESLTAGEQQDVATGVLFPLATLKSLRLYGSVLSSSPAQPLFTLSHLTLGKHPIGIISSDPVLATRLLQSSITSLAITIPYIPRLSPLFHTTILLPLAPQLLHLVITCQRARLPTMSSFLGLCSRLEHVVTPDFGILLHILHPIKRWSTSLSADGFSDAIVQILESDVTALSKLELLEFSAISDEVADKFGFRARLAPICERRGIELAFSG